MPVKRLLITVAALAALPAIVLAEPAGAPHAADCVAALKAREPILAASLKAGTSAEGELLKVVRSGMAIVGTQYLAGLGEARAKQLLEAAERAFARLGPAAAQQRQAQCLQEGDALYRNASALEQGFINHAAKKRLKRLQAA